MYLIRCYVGVAFEIFVKGKQQQPDDSGKKRKREEEESAMKGKGKKQNKRSKGKKNNNQAEEEEQSNGTANGTTNNNDTQTTTNNTNANSDDTKWTDLKSYLTIISEGPLHPLNFDPDQETTIDEKSDYVPMPHGPDGLRYHLMDIWLDELEKVLEFEQEEGENEGEEGKPRKVKSEVPMDLILEPIETLRVQGLHKPVRTRAAEVLEDERLVEWGFRERKVEEEEDEDSDEEWGGFAD